MKLSDIQDNVAQNDAVAFKKQGALRQPKLTLKHLHKLRKIRELKELERANTAKKLELIYAAPSGDSTGGMSF